MNNLGKIWYMLIGALLGAIVVYMVPTSCDLAINGVGTAVEGAGNLLGQAREAVGGINLGGE